ncbi:MAG: hypothetical protein VXW65_08955 [Pseudomonadota bacterium]|nr:hypothetical protein [Pseudomonadota bacterium]
MLKPILALCTAVLFVGCATTPSAPVIQRDNNQFETTGMGKTRAAALDTALKAASKTCQRSQAIVISDQTQYNGVVDEKTGRLIEQVGTAVGVMTGMKTPQIARDDDYAVTVKFYCKA